MTSTHGTYLWSSGKQTCRGSSYSGHEDNCNKNVDI
jgi:hypothetical protein